MHRAHVIYVKMKSTKKQIIKLKTNKDQVVESNPKPGIQTFFKPAPKTFAIDENRGENKPEEKSNNGDKKFYVGLLKEKLRSEFFSFSIGRAPK